jgi:hypothetical protein
VFRKKKNVKTEALEKHQTALRRAKTLLLSHKWGRVLDDILQKKNSASSSPLPPRLSLEDHSYINRVLYSLDLSDLTGSSKAPGTIGIADFDGTGSLGAQIYFANVVLNADGTVYAQGTDLNWPTTIGYGSLALDVLDVEGNNDGVLELITAGKIWSVSAGSLTLLKDINDAIDADASIIGDYYVKTWRNAVPITESRVMISAADYDLDGNIELIYSIDAGTRYIIKKIITNTDPVIDKNIFYPLNKEYQKSIGSYYSPFKVKKLLDTIDELIEINNLQFIEHNVEEIFVFIAAS